MKKSISILLSVFIFASCNNKTSTEKEMVGMSGAGIKNNNILTDTSRITKTTILPNGTTTTTVTTTTKPVHISPEKNEGQVNKSTTGNNGNESVNSQASAKKMPTNTNNTTNNTTNGTNNNNTENTKNKGWSDAAIGATAGGVGGSVLGAVVSKDKVKGAIIGGVIGGGTGYIIGRSRDRKSGRVKKKHTTQNN